MTAGAILPVGCVAVGVLLAGCGEAVIYQELQPGTLRAEARAPAASDNPVPITSVFDCPAPDGAGFEFTLRRGPGELALWLPPMFERPYLVLAQRHDGHPAEFVEGDVSVTIKERFADLRVGDEAFPDCERNGVRSEWEHAKLAGFDFRATSTEPDWSLDLQHDGSFEFRSENPDIQIRATTPASDRSGSETRYAAEQDGRLVEIRISAVYCNLDDGIQMFGSTVTVQVDSHVFFGCGRALH